MAVFSRKMYALPELAGANHLEKTMTKPTTAAKRPSRNTPISKEAVKRIQRTTTVSNGGQQAPWVRRLQSKADKQGN